MSVSLGLELQVVVSYKELGTKYGSSAKEVFLATESSSSGTSSLRIDGGL